MDSRKDLLLALGVIALGIAVIAIAYSWPEPLIRDAVGPRAFPYGLGLLFVCGGAFVALQRLRNMHAAAGYRCRTRAARKRKACRPPGCARMTIIGLCVLYTLALNPHRLHRRDAALHGAGAHRDEGAQSGDGRRHVDHLHRRSPICSSHTVLGGRLPEGVLAGHAAL